MKRPFQPSPEEFEEMEEDAADNANTINFAACRAMGVHESFIQEWSEGVLLLGTEGMEPFVLEDYPGLKDNAQEAVVELDRLTKCQKIFWYPFGVAPQDLSVCPGNLILTGSRPRVVQDWTKPGLNQRLLIPDVHYGTMDSFLEKLRPKAYMAGLDFRDCFFHWKMHKKSRKWLGLRHPITHRLGVFLFVPFGLGPAPGINDRNVAEVIRVCKLRTLELEVTAFVDDLRLINDTPSQLSESDDKDILTFKLIEFKENCEYLGMEVHEKPGKLIWPTQLIGWIGWEINSVAMIVELTTSKIEKGDRLVSGLLLKCTSNQPILAKEAMSVWGFLNFIANVIKQAQPFTRELGRTIVEAEVFQAWSSGKKRFNPAIKLNAITIDDLKWWKDLFQTRPYRKIHHVCGRSFIWHQKLHDLQGFRQEAWNAGLLLILGLDASSKIGWGITLGDTYLQGKWEGEDVEKHINWKELKAYEIALDALGRQLSEKILYVKSDNAAALHYINSGRGRIDGLSSLAKSIRLKEVALAIESVAVHIPGKLNVTPDALSRYFFNTTFRDKRPDRTLRKRLFGIIQKEVGLFTLDGMAADDGHNALVSRFCSPSNPLFEEKLDNQFVWVFPPLELIGITLKFLISSKREGTVFSCCCLVPERSNAPWFRYLQHFESIKRFNPGSDLFRSFNGSSFDRDPPVKEYWRVLRLQ